MTALETPQDRIQACVEEAKLLNRCGTSGGYARHYRRGEVPCDPCRDAHAFDMRRSRARGNSPRPPAVCGSTAGEQRHRRAGEPVCDACREARKLYKRQWRAAPVKPKPKPPPPPPSARGYTSPYSVEFRAEVVQASTRMGVKPAAAHYRVSPSTLATWRQSAGVTALPLPPSAKVVTDQEFTAEERTEILAFMRKTGSVTKTMQKFGVTRKTLTIWREEDIAAERRARPAPVDRPLLLGPQYGPLNGLSEDEAARVQQTAHSRGHARYSSYSGMSLA